MAFISEFNAPEPDVRHKTSPFPREKRQPAIMMVAMLQMLQMSQRFILALANKK